MKFAVVLYVVVFCLVSLCLQAESPVNREPLRLRFVNGASEPVFGVYIIHKRFSYLLTTSNIDGECVVNTENVRPTDTLQIQGMGYQVINRTFLQLQKSPQVVLQDLAYALDEVRVTSLDVDALLAKVSAQLKKQDFGGSPVCRLYGNALYEKITECRSCVVEYRREYGHYFTSGDVKPHDVWDKDFRSYMVPAYTARSYNLTCGGGDTLTPVFLTSDDIRFDVGTRKIFTLMRAVQLFGPLFDGVKPYFIRRISTDSNDYEFAFNTWASFYPGSTRITCKGTFVIDRELHRLKSMTFDYIDYQLFRQAIMTNQRKVNSPFSTKSRFIFEYTPGGECYIKSCTQETSWKYNLGEEFMLIEQPSRQHPGVNHLVEREAFQCFTYQDIPEGLQTSKMLVKIHLAQRYPVGVYDSNVFDGLPPLLDNQHAINDLNSFMDVDRQFHRHSGEAYYPDNYISGFRGWKKSNEIYHANLSAVRKQLFEKFPFIP